MKNIDVKLEHRLLHSGIQMNFNTIPNCTYLQSKTVQLGSFS